MVEASGRADAPTVKTSAIASDTKPMSAVGRKRSSLLVFGELRVTSHPLVRERGQDGFRPRVRCVEAPPCRLLLQATKAPHFAGLSLGGAYPDRTGDLRLAKAAQWVAVNRRESPNGTRSRIGRISGSSNRCKSPRPVSTPFPPVQPSRCLVEVHNAAAVVFPAADAARILFVSRPTLMS